MTTATSPAQPRDHLPKRAEDLPDLIPIPEWAAYTGLSIPTLARQRMEGKGAPFVRLGTAVRYPRKKALAWLDSLAEAS